jgi:DNA-binding CsgD family transcriptional regulator
MPAGWWSGVRGCRRASSGVRAASRPTFETAFVDASGHLRGVRAQHLPLCSGDAIVGVLILAFGVRQPPSEPVGFVPQRRLTPRQREILDLIASGLTTDQIARELTLSTQTVRNHLRSVLRELHAHSRLEAIVTAEHLGLRAAPPLGPRSPDAGSHTHDK